MRRRNQLTVAAAAVVIASSTGTGIAVAAGGDDAEPPITGVELEQATAAALAYTGGGTVTDTEVGDEESRYEVEVTMADSRQVDVQLDEAFRVVGGEVDVDESADDDDDD